MNARKLSLWYKAVADAEEALAACPKSQAEVEAGLPERVDAAQAYRDALVTARNIVLANDPASAKGALLGTISGPATADAKAATDAGLTKEDATALLTRAAELRAAALALVPVG